MHYLKQFKVMDQVRFWWSVTSGQEPNIQLSLLILTLVLILVFQKVGNALQSTLVLLIPMYQDTEKVRGGLTPSFLLQRPPAADTSSVKMDPGHEFPVFLLK